MYLLGVLCLLSAAVALPTPEQLHTNLPAPPPPSELKSEDKDYKSDVLEVDEPISSSLDKPESEEAKNPPESAEKSKAEKDEDNDKLDDAINVIQKESKESKESLDSKEKPKESKESKEPSDSKDIEERPEEHKEEIKEKDSKSEESKEGDEEDGPIIVQVIENPSQKGFFSNLLQWLPYPHIHFPWSSRFASKLRNGGQREQPIFIVRESDFPFDDDN